MAILELEIQTCDECPFVETKGGNATTYICPEIKLDPKSAQILGRGSGRVIASNVDYKSEMPPIPDWCPHLKRKD